jgi:hypothetical protein
MFNYSGMDAKDRIHGQDKVKDLLIKSFKESKERNPAFSLRMFAIRLGIQAPVVSEVMSGKRLISRNLAQKILVGLKVERQLADDLLIHFPVKQSREKKQNKAFINPDQFQLISDWWYMAIMSLAETEGCQACPKFLAKRFNITAEQAGSAVRILLELGYLSQENNLLKASGKYLRFSSTVPDESIKKHHRQGLELAKDALTEIQIELRDFGSITFKGDPQLLEMARKKLRALRNEISVLMNTSKANEVYRLQMQLFPLTKSKDII